MTIIDIDIFKKTNVLISGFSQFLFFKLLKYVFFTPLYFVNLQVQPSNYICRMNNTECDVPEYCDGETGQVCVSHFKFYYSQHK